MASKRQIFVGSVPIGGGAPVVVQTMTKTETANLAATMEQIRKVAEAGADVVRCAVPREQDVEALKTIVKRIADPDYRRHPLQPHPGAESDRRRRPLHPPQPRQHRRPRQSRRGRREGERTGVPMRIGVNSGSLPKHLHALEREAPVEALVAAAVEFTELMESLDFENFKVSIKSTNVPYTIAANRLLAEKIPYPLHLGDHRGGDEMGGLAEIGGRAGDAARRRGRRHDPDQPLDLPRRGGGQSRLGDPQGAAAARERPGPDRLPDLRPPAVRHGLGRGRNRAAAGRLRGAGRGRRPRLRGQRDRRGQPRRLRHRRGQERGPDLRRRQTAAQGPAGEAGRHPVRRDRQVAGPRQGRVRRGRVAARAPPGWPRSSRKTPAT